MSALSSLLMTMMMMMMMMMRLKDVYDEGCCMMDGADGRGWQMMATFNVGQHFKYSQMHPAQTPTCAHLTNTQRYTSKIHTQTHNRAKPFERYTKIHLKNCTARSFCKSFLHSFWLRIFRCPRVFAVLPKYLPCSQSIGNGAGRSRCNEIRTVSCGAARQTHTT